MSLKMFTWLRKSEADKRTAENKMNSADKIRTEQIRSEKKVAVRQGDGDERPHHWSEGLQNTFNSVREIVRSVRHESSITNI